VRFFAEQRINYLRSRLNFSGIRSAFELGAGDGFATASMLALVPEIFVSDISLLMLTHNPASPGFKVQAAGERLPVVSDAVDLVFCWEVLHHVADVQATLIEAARVSRKYVVFFEPNRNHPAQWLFSLVKRSERGGLKFTKQYCRRMCEVCGLKILSMEVVGCIFPNMTPAWLFPLVKRLPFIQPYTGISIAVIARKN
jgi:ubiquinone/menaquinone biosynthesis C-methylase UbiE